MIKSIKMNNCVPFQQAEISDCKKVNFIFGANGSGKSTISTFLKKYLDNNPRFESSSIEWDNPNHETIEVYNREFRQENLQEEMPGIFTLGSENIKENEEIDQLMRALDQKEKDLVFEKGLLDKCEKEDKPICEAKFRDAVWERILKKNDKDFSKAFEGFRGSKERFSGEVIKRKTGISGDPGRICDRDDLLKRSQALYSSKLEKCNMFYVRDIQDLLFNLNQIKNDSIWESVIVGNTDVNISALIKELDNASWVSQGRQYLHDNSRKCPFCQQETITDEFRQKLESFFDKEYERKKNCLKEKHDYYDGVAQQIVYALETVIQDRDAAVQIGQLNVELLATRKDLLKDKLENNIKTIEEKISEPGKKIVIVDVSDLVNEILNQFVLANKMIEDYNQLVDNHAQESKRLTDDIWTTCLSQEEDLIKTYLKEIDKFEKEIKGRNITISRKEQDINRLKTEIEEREEKLTGVETSINKINNYLRIYGFTNFSIQPADNKKNYYCIKRDDGTKVVNTLSEGEETFLTFLYFMQKVDGSIEQGHIADKKIIVLDDPICSLDSTVLYIVSNMVQELIDRIKDNTNSCRATQLFVLTHNVFFHKEASHVGGKAIERSFVNYWIIRKNNNIASIKPYGMKNPIATSYELLWRELNEENETSFISIQNVMRRIIEFYFTLLGGEDKDDIIKKIVSIEDKIIAKSLFQWINGGSHTIPDDLAFEPETDTLNQYKKVFKRIFELSGHLSHYNMMMKKIGAQNNTEQAQ
ncbi:MAG: AAA family ATPase [Bacteroidales bacterium]|nr:AAA family ATPase [Bacteroidales bacterium]